VGHALIVTSPRSAIINVSAPQAFLPMAGQSHVCAAKAGVDMLTRVLAIEWGGDGVRVNSVVPGPIEGAEGVSRLAPNPEAHEIVQATVPAGRWGTPRDVADVCLFLASPLAAYVTGVVLPADGGGTWRGRHGDDSDRRPPVREARRRIRLTPAEGRVGTIRRLGVPDRLDQRYPCSVCHSAAASTHRARRPCARSRCVARAASGHVTREDQARRSSHDRLDHLAS
jgi:hypothetical protein